MKKLHVLVVKVKHRQEVYKGGNIKKMISYCIKGIAC